MDARNIPWLNLGLAVIAGYAGAMGLAVICHSLGLVSRATEVGYPYTNYLATCVNLGSVGAYFLLNALLGCAFRHGWPIALGMMLPWPIACGIEISHDPTTHNLFPFEAILTWLPAFLLAFLGTYSGRKFALRFRG